MDRQGLIRHKVLICKSAEYPRNRFPAWRVGRQLYLTYRPAKLHRLDESIPGLLKHLQIRALIGGGGGGEEGRKQHYLSWDPEPEFVNF